MPSAAGEGNLRLVRVLDDPRMPVLTGHDGLREGLVVRLVGGAIPTKLAVLDDRRREVLRAVLALADHVENDAYLRADACRHHAKRQGRIGPGGDDANGLHGSLATLRAQLERDEVEPLSYVGRDRR